MNQVTISSDYKTVNIPPDMLEEVKYLVKKRNPLNFYKVSSNMDYAYFDDIVTYLVNHCNFMLELIDNKELDPNIIEEYKEILPVRQNNKEYSNIPYYYFSHNKEPLIGKTIDNLYKINKKIEEITLIKDLTKAKEDTIIDMKYFMGSEEISTFDKLYTTAIEKKDITTMQEMLGKVQEKILEEWSNYSKDLHKMTDDNFCFLGHSSKTTEYKGEFRTKYVSCSLFNQDVNDAFNNGFGFIMEPINIVGADSRDMYVDNDAIDIDNLTAYSSIKKIHHPQRLLDECLKLKKENQEKGKNYPVYSEVVTLGFHPTAIFCFTNGAKSYDYNYREAHKLQKNFPNLKMYTFDVMRRKKGVDLESFKLELVDSLLEKLTSHTGGCNPNDLFRYDYFFEEFAKLKKKENYTENDIEIIFRKNRDMLSILDNTADKLFTSNYSFDEIKYILGKNCSYDIDSITKGKITPFAINRLGDLLPYKDKLNDYYDGLTELVEIVSRFEVTSSMIEEIKSNETINLYTISKCLTKKYMAILNDSEKKIKFELQKDRIEKEELLKEKDYREEIEKEYSFYRDIEIFKDFAKPIKETYKKVDENITSNDNEFNILLDKQDELEKKLSELINLREKEKTSNYHNLKITTMINNITEELNSLSRHPILNSRKINNRKKEISKLTDERQTEEQEYNKQKDKKIAGIDKNIDTIETEIRKNKDQIEIVKSRKNELNGEKQIIMVELNNYFKCDSIDKIDDMVEKSKEVVKNYDISNSFTLYQINDRLEKINQKILGNEMGMNKINEERKSVQVNL